MFDKNKFLADLEKLVNIDCGTYNPIGTKKIVDILIKKFNEIGFKTQTIDVGNKVGPLLVATNKDSDSYDALIIGHTDTVYPEGVAAKHQMRIEGNRIYGLGTIDMKSGLLQGIYALESLDKSILDKLSICFICNPDEEISSIFSEPEIEKFAKKSKCALVVESAGGDGILVNKRKGIARFKVKFVGKADHASTPEKGISAIRELAHFIIKLEEFNNVELNTTYNVSPIKGGTVGNVIAENAELDFEVRFLDVDSYNAMKSKIDNFVREPAISGIKTTIEQLSFKPAMNNSPENSWIEDLVVDSANKVGLNMALKTSGGGSDGNYISYIGIPTMDGLGPVGDAWHNEDNECLFIDSVESRIKLLQEILKSLSLR